MKKCDNCDHCDVCEWWAKHEHYGISDDAENCNCWNGWHNIADDPSDLPTDGGNFLVFVRGDIYYTCNDCTAEKFADYVRNGNVLKWKYIEEA